MPFELLFSKLGPPGKQNGRSRQQRLYDLLRRAILDGVLLPGSALPGSRKLALDYGIARNTVVYAYEMLRAEGFVVADKTSTHVAKLPLVPVRSSDRSQNTQSLLSLSQRSHRLGLVKYGSEHLPFAVGIPDLNLFPWSKWLRHLERAWKSVGARHLAYAPIGGERSLRAAIAAQLRLTRGLSCTSDQVLITAGAQMAIDVCARMLGDPGDVAWMETPGYSSARAALDAAGLKLVHVPVDQGGMAATVKLWKCQPPKLVFVTPSHQYPMGSVMPLERRLKLLELARANRSWIIEDDYDGDLHHSGQQIPPICSLADQAAVVYVGTFSKSLYPGLRMGYMVVPSWISERMASGMHQLFPPGQALEQLALASFIESGDLARHLRNMRSIYRERQLCLRAHLEKCFGQSIRILGGEAGAHLTIVFAQDVDDKAVSERAAAFGVSTRALSDYGSHTDATKRIRGLVLGYGASDATQIAILIPRLKQAVDSVISTNSLAVTGRDRLATRHTQRKG